MSNLSPEQFGPEFDPLRTGDKRLDINNIRQRYDALDMIQRDRETRKVRPLRPLSPYRLRVIQSVN